MFCSPKSRRLVEGWCLGWECRFWKGFGNLRRGDVRSASAVVTIRWTVLCTDTSLRDLVRLSWCEHPVLTDDLSNSHRQPLNFAKQGGHAHMLIRDTCIVFLCDARTTIPNKAVFVLIRRVLAFLYDVRAEEESNWALMRAARVFHERLLSQHCV